MLNPEWRDGVTLPILFTVDPRLVWTSAARSVRRVARR